MKPLRALDVLGFENSEDIFYSYFLPPYTSGEASSSGEEERLEKLQLSRGRLGVVGS